MYFYFGPMSKNIVDVLIQLSLSMPEKQIVFIPSRRQIDASGGYVNNWTTESFAHYVRSRNPAIKLQRDHGGPDQGHIFDDGFASLKNDCAYFDILHIDPWKRYQDFNEGLDMTVKLIKYCYSINPKLQFEVSTEEAIRHFKTSELEKLLVKLQNRLEPQEFQQIRYAVIQCGTALCEMKNCGVFNPSRLTKMLEITRKFHVLAKEHNGDWVTPEEVKIKQSYGLQHINIAPELASFESKIILDTVKQNKEDYAKLFELCLASDKWRKWVTPTFDPIQQKDEVILICCHYLFSSPDFLKIKLKYSDLDTIIQENLMTYLKAKIEL